MPPYSEDVRHTVAKHIRFPQKLWLLVNAGDNEIMTWCRNGASIYVDLSALDSYLQSGESLFRTRHLYTFLRQLNQYGFQKVSRHRQLSAAADGATESSYIQEYTSEFFKRNRPFLLNNLIRRSGAGGSSTRRVVVPKRLMRRRCRPGVDACERIDSKAVTGLRRARCRLRAYLQKEWLQQLLNEKLADCAAAAEAVDDDWNEDGGGGSGAAIELAADLFENAADSVSNFEQKNVAGYYGKVRMGAVQSFFGEYLPTYSNDDGTRVTDGLQNDDDELMQNVDMDGKSLLISNQSEPILDPPLSSSSTDPLCTAPPMFKIIANASSDVPYSIQIISEPAAAVHQTTANNASKEFETINYDDDEKDILQSIAADTADEEGKTNIFAPSDETDLNMEEFFRMSADRDGTTKDQPYTLDNPFKTELIDSAEMAVANDNRCDNNNNNNAVIDDDFFKQLQESMNVLNDLY